MVHDVNMCIRPPWLDQRHENHRYPESPLHKIISFDKGGMHVKGVTLEEINLPVIWATETGSRSEPPVCTKLYAQATTPRSAVIQCVPSVLFHFMNSHCLSSATAQETDRHWLEDEGLDNVSKSSQMNGPTENKIEVKMTTDKDRGSWGDL